MTQSADLNTAQAFLDKYSASIEIIYKTYGFYNTFLYILNIVKNILPIDRINAVTISRESHIITLADTDLSRQVQYTNSINDVDKITIIASEAIHRDIIINDLEKYRPENMDDGVVFPYMQHNSLLRICFFHNDSMVILLNFWSNTNDAFLPEHIELLKSLVGPMQGAVAGALSELSFDKATMPFEKTASSIDRVVQCHGLVKSVELLRSVAPTDCTVLITGETGVGKGAIAQAIHELSLRKGGPFVHVNCSAIPESLLSTEFFGHERGAFTGAYTMRKGYFEQANEGTIFLDEIGDMSLMAQTHLLTILDSGYITRVGSPVPHPVNVRIICATNCDLKEAVRSGAFRKDLYYRIATFNLDIPPLRKRREDISILANSFLSKYGHLLNNKTATINKTEMQRLLAYNWPGNVRELEHVVERAIIELRTNISSGELNFGFLLNSDQTHEDFFDGWPTLQQMEERYIKAVLNKTKGKMTGRGSATEILGIHYTTLKARMQNFR